MNEIETGEAVCRGSIQLGTACGGCQRCKAAAWDWICHNLAAVDYWAVMRTGRHDPMRAVLAAAKTRQGAKKS